MRLRSDRGRFLLVVALLGLCVALGLVLAALPAHRQAHHPAGHALRARALSPEKRPRRGPDSL